MSDLVPDKPSNASRTEFFTNSGNVYSLIGVIFEMQGALYRLLNAAVLSSSFDDAIMPEIETAMQKLDSANEQLSKLLEALAEEKANADGAG